MATLAGTNLTLIDWAKQCGPDGKIMALVNTLSQTNEMLKEMVWVEANGSIYHSVMILTGLPEATWRQFYKGVVPSKSTRVRVNEPISTFKAHSVVDQNLADLSGDVAQFRMNEAAPFVEAMNQEMQKTVLMGSATTDRSQFNGLAPRFNKKSAVTGENIVDAKGAGNDNTSIWLIGWGENSIYGAFPNGSQAGPHEDLGQNHQTEAENGGYYSAYHDTWTWKAGLVVEDWRYVVRIANIDVSKLVEDSDPADLLGI